MSQDWRRQRVLEPYLYMFYVSMCEGGKMIEEDDQSVSTMTDDVREKLAVSLSDYCAVISMGELRHHTLFGAAASRSAVFGNASLFTKKSLLRGCIEYFGRTTDWSGQFGGSKWRNIADLALKYTMGDLPATLFVDTVASVVHNGGMIFDKGVMWRLHTSQVILKAILTQRSNMTSMFSERLISILEMFYGAEYIRLLKRSRFTFYADIPVVSWGEIEFDPPKHRAALRRSSVTAMSVTDDVVDDDDDDEEDDDDAQVVPMSNGSMYLLKYQSFIVKEDGQWKVCNCCVKNIPVGSAASIYAALDDGWNGAGEIPGWTGVSA